MFTGAVTGTGDDAALPAPPEVMQGIQSLHDRIDELDGPAARALNLGNRYPDFQFPQMVSPPAMVSPDWEPTFIDYLFLAFTNAAAFSPTDTMPMSRWAKAAMTLQAVISIVTVALVVSRAVNIRPAG